MCAEASGGLPSDAQAPTNAKRLCARDHGHRLRKGFRLGKTFTLLKATAEVVSAGIDAPIRLMICFLQPELLQVILGWGGNINRIADADEIAQSAIEHPSSRHTSPCALGSDDDAMATVNMAGNLALGAPSDMDHESQVWVLSASSLARVAIGRVQVMRPQKSV